FITLRQCSGINNLFTKVREIAVKKDYDLIYNDSNDWHLGIGARGYFQFYRFNKSPISIYRGRLRR
ncbi:MAG: hypothetical protein AABX05_00825, partial [Nanoarchaeota archaeon]